ncbi:MAG: hypothetical protein KC466_15825, partial [Myxococcales bacterium]|nr:hypothetical protein [Myxococcales bacterium]
MDSGARALLLAVAVYTVATVVVGLWRSRETRDEGEDFYLAGRGLGAWLIALSGAASGESGWVLLGLVGAAYTGGVGALWVIPGMLAGYAFNWFVLAPRLRAASIESGALTIPSVLAARHPESAGAIRAAGTTVLLLFVTAYVAAQFTAVGKSLEAMFGLPYVAGVFAGLAVVFAYVISGGFRASVWTDVVQALFMVVALVGMPIVAASRLGGAGLGDLGGIDGMLDPLGGTHG